MPYIQYINLLLDPIWSKATFYMINQTMKILITKYTRSATAVDPPAFKSQRVGYQSNQKLLHHYQHSKNQLIS